MTMIKNTRYKIVLLAGIFLLPGALAQDINVDFVATIKGTTCNITLEGHASPLMAIISTRYGY